MKKNEITKHYLAYNLILARIVCTQKKIPPRREVALLFYELLRGEGGNCGPKE